MKKSLLIIDGSSLMYRAFFALPPLTNKNGLNTGAVYGFSTMLVKLLQTNSFDYLCVAFDKGRITFRNSIFEDYKGTRKTTPPELSEQFPVIRQLLSCLGITTLEIENYEADDIIGTLAVAAEQKNIETTILTGDRDALQLITANTKVLMTKKGISEMKCYDLLTFQEEYQQLPPSALIEIKALMGDTSDNIPGIAGIGEKTALKLIAEFKNIETLLNNIDKVAGVKLKEKLREQAHLAIVSKTLATINTEVPLEYDFSEFVLNPNIEELDKLLEFLAFRNIKEKFLTALKIVPQEQPPEKIIEANCTLCQVDNGELTEKLADLDPDTVVVFEYLYQGEFPRYSFQQLNVYFNNIEYQVTQDLVAATNNLISYPGIKVCLDLKSFVQACLNNKIEVATKNFYDLAIMAYLVDATGANYNIETLLKEYLPESTDCKLVNLYKTYLVLQEKIVSNQLEKLLVEMELPLTFVLAEMEYNGINIDQEKLETMTKELAVELKILEHRIRGLAGEEFNLNSPKQLGKILFDKLQLPVIKKTKTGYSTDVEVLEKLVNFHDIVPNILEYRTLSKLFSTYLEGLANIINPETHKIHTHFQQTVTSTGRLSSTQPNLQNIPVRTPLGKKIREFFVPSPGYDYILSLDYSQIELRILAHMSKDEILIDAFKHNQDIHTRTAAEVFNLPLNEVPAHMRSRAKAVNFGIVYGISDYGLSQDLNISRKEAADYIEKYFNRYQGVKDFIERTILEAKMAGYVQTLYNRQRFLPDINSSNFNRRSFAERTAMNTPIQGTAADIIKIAMIKVAEILKVHNFKSRLLLQVHDELLLEVVESELLEVTQLVKDAMQNAASLVVPLTVDSAYGANWSASK